MIPNRPIPIARLVGRTPGSYDKSHVVHLRQIGKWFYVDYSYDGKRVRKTLNTDNLKIALRLRTDLEQNIHHKLLNEPVVIRLDKFLDEYLKYIRSKLARKNVATQLGYMNRFSASVPEIKLSQITPSQIEAFLMTVRGGKPSPKTWNTLRGNFHAMLEYAKKHGYLAENVVAIIERRREIQRTIRFLNSEEIGRLLALCEDNPLQSVVATFIYAGLRRSEACWLRRDDVDLEGKLLHVREKQVAGESWCPKTRRNRVVPISSRLLPFLTSQSRSKDWVFPSPDGKRWDPDNLTHKFAHIVRGIKLPWTLLDLRHTFGSHLAMKGVSLYKIATFMGNSPEICRKHYAALIPEKLHEDVEF